MRHNPDNCHVCSVIRDNSDLSNVAVAQLAHTTESSVRRHKIPMHDPLLAKDSFFTEIPEAIITSRGTSRRLSDGSWEKITYRPQDLALYEAAKYDDLEQAIAKFPPAPNMEPEGFGRGATEVLCLSDFQLGKTEANGGTKETVARVLRAVDRFVAKCQVSKPAEIFLFELGDVLENFDNTGTQRGTNDLDLTMQIRTARRLLLEVLYRVRDLAPRIVFVSIPSNHCSVRISGTKDLASTSNNDWGIEISHQLADCTSGREGWGHIEFVRTEGHDEALTVTTQDGTVIGAVHGHQANNHNKVGDWWRGQSHGRRNNLHNADLLLHGHYHNLSVSQSGDARWIIGTPSSDGGSSWFTNKTGESSVAGMAAFTVVNGMWHDLRIC